MERELEVVRPAAQRSEGRAGRVEQQEGVALERLPGANTPTVQCAEKLRRSLSRRFITVHLIQIKGNWEGGVVKWGDRSSKDSKTTFLEEALPKVPCSL